MKRIIFIPGGRAERAPYPWLEKIMKRFPLRFFHYRPRKQISHWRKGLSRDVEVEVFEWSRYWQKDHLYQTSLRLTTILQSNPNIVLITESIGAEIVYQVPDGVRSKVFKIVALAPTYHPGHTIPQNAIHIVTPFDIIAPTATLFLWPLATIKHLFGRRSGNRIWTWILRHDRFYPEQKIYLTRGQSLGRLLKKLISD